MIPISIDKSTYEELCRRKQSKERVGNVINRLMDDEFVPIMNENVNLDRIRKKITSIDLNDETYERLIRRQIKDFKLPSISKTIDELIKRKTQ